MLTGSELFLGEPVKHQLPIPPPPEILPSPPQSLCVEPGSLVSHHNQLNSTGVEAPEQPRISCKEIRPATVSGWRHTNARDLEQEGNVSLGAVVGVKPGKSNSLATLREIMIFQIGWQRGDVEAGNQRTVRSRRMVRRRAARQIAAELLSFAGSTIIRVFGLFSTAVSTKQ